MAQDMALGGMPAAAGPGDTAASTLSELLDAGKFALYHLSKSKAAFEAGDMATAYYQIRASLSHEKLDEAVALKAEIKKRGGK